MWLNESNFPVSTVLNTELGKKVQKTTYFLYLLTIVCYILIKISLSIDYR